MSATSTSTFYNQPPLTMGDINKMLAKVGELKSQVMPSIKVVPDEYLTAPKIQLSAKFAKQMPSDFVSKTNQWLEDFFGTEIRTYLIDTTGIVMNGGKVYVVGKSNAVILGIKETP